MTVKMGPIIVIKLKLNRIRGFGRKMMVCPLLLLLTFLLLAMGVAQSASFDCKKAETIVEGIICSDEAISELDERMASYYKRAAEKGDERVKIEQEYWLSSVRNKCERDYCVKNAYVNRISELYGDIVRKRLKPFDFDKYMGSYIQPGKTSCFIDGPDGKSVQSVCDISNSLTIKRNMEKGHYTVSFGIVGANFHQCMLEDGVAHATDNLIVYKYHPFDENLNKVTSSQCEIVFEFIEDEILLHKIAARKICATRHFCGMRAGFDGFKFQLKDKVPVSKASE